MTLYALVASDCTFAVDVFVSRSLAERALAEVLVDEPSFVSLLAVVAIAPPWEEDLGRRGRGVVQLVVETVVARMEEEG